MCVWGAQDACAVGGKNWSCAGIWCVGGGLSVWGKKYGALLGAGFVYGGKICVCAGGEGFFMHEKRLLYSIDLLGGGAGKWGKNATTLSIRPHVFQKRKK